MPGWFLLISNLPERYQTLRMQLWRGLESAGTTSLRDGAYLLPSIYREVGGVPVAEAAGLAAIVSEARALQQSDDELIDSLSPVLDILYASLSMEKLK